MPNYIVTPDGRYYRSDDCTTVNIPEPEAGQFEREMNVNIAALQHWGYALPRRD